MFARFYKLKSPHTNAVYVGSTTTTLAQRLRGHKLGYIKYLRCGLGYVSSYDVMRWPDVTIELIEEAEYNDKQAIRAREGVLIQQTQHTVNKRREHGQSLAQLGAYEYYQWYRFNNPDAYRAAAERFRNKRIERGELCGRLVACERCGRRHRLSHQQQHETKHHIPHGPAAQEPAEGGIPHGLRPAEGGIPHGLRPAEGGCAERKR